MSLNFPTVVTPRGQVHYRTKNEIKWLMEVWCGKIPPPITINVNVSTDQVRAALTEAMRKPRTGRMRY